MCRGSARRDPCAEERKQSNGNAGGEVGVEADVCGSEGSGRRIRAVSDREPCRVVLVESEVEGQALTAPRVAEYGPYGIHQRAVFGFGLSWLQDGVSGLAELEQLKRGVDVGRAAANDVSRVVAVAVEWAAS